MGKTRINIPALMTISAAFAAVAALEVIPYSTRGEAIATYGTGSPGETGIIVLEDGNARDRAFKVGNEDISFSSGSCYQFTINREILSTDRIVGGKEIPCPD